MISFIKKLLISLTLISTLLFTNLAFAEVTDVSNPEGFLKDRLDLIFNKFSEETGLIPLSDTSSKFVLQAEGYYNITSVVYAIIGLMKYVAYAIMSIVVVISIVKLITAGIEGAAEVWGSRKQYLLQILIAVGVILTAEFMFNKVMLPSAVGSIAGAKEAAGQIGGELAGIVGIIQGIIVIFSICMLIFAGTKMVANMGDEEAMSKAKNQIFWGAGGLLVVMFGGTLVNEIIFVNAQSVDPIAGSRLIVNITNFISGIIGTISLMAFFYAGSQYIVGGFTEVNQESIKNAIFGGIIGLVIALGAFAIVNTVIDLDNPNVQVFDKQPEF